MTIRLRTARFKLSYERPYLASMIWALIPVEKEGFGTLAVDKHFRLYYDPKFVQDDSEWSIDELTTVLYHEINHLLRDHLSRGEHLNHHIEDPLEKNSKLYLFNVAGDAEINESIREEKTKWQFPVFKGPDGKEGGLIFPETFCAETKQLAERYYELLLKDAKTIQVTGIGAGQCGSSAHGQSEGDDPAPDGEGNNPGVGKTEGDLLRKTVAKEIKEASKSRGTVPAHLERWADEQLEEKVDWRKEFQAELKRAIAYKRGAKDYTFQRLSRRNDGDIILPSVHQPIPNVSAIIDTSGSMGSRQINQCVAEVGAMLKSSIGDSGLTVLSVDADVHSVGKVMKRKDIKPIGGGGTDMRVGMAAAEKLKPRPDIMVVLTDGETPWPDNPPRGIRTIICLLPYQGWRGVNGFTTPDWAKTIVVEFE